jgi:4-alpha-glucanotransferase
VNDILSQRRAGILLHISSLPSRDFGQDAYKFVDFLADTSITVWQTLPLGMTHPDGSPYQCLSAHAGNPAFISLADLLTEDWLLPKDIPENIETLTDAEKAAFMVKVYTGFIQQAPAEDREAYANFCRDKAIWLDDFALFIVLRNEFGESAWNEWPIAFKERDVEALNDELIRLKSEIERVKFEQFIFFRQWLALKAYANQRNVLVFGDIPIFVAYDSADVWANRAEFKLDENGAMSVVAGVPPDYFSATGQRWGNPHYNWSYMEHNGFKWWRTRIKTQLEIFDILRIDHFRGLEAAWEIPAYEETAIHGGWAKAPGHALLRAILEDLGGIPLVAEDLGIITPEVEALRDEFCLPGMKILQFAFGGNADNPYLPNHHIPNCVVYTGTHDNDTTLGWLNHISDEQRHYIRHCLGHPSEPLHDALIQTALASVANLAVIPMQDLLELGSEDRMNTPGTTVGNWQWRFQWSQIKSERILHFKHLLRLYNRVPGISAPED